MSNIRLHPDIVAWCDEAGVSYTFEIKRSVAEGVLDADIIWKRGPSPDRDVFPFKACVPIIKFDNKKDAVAFRLRWL